MREEKGRGISTLPLASILQVIMSPTRPASLEHVPGVTAKRRGLLLAILLSLLFMIITAYSSAATLVERVGSNEVMRAASGGAWSGRIAYEMVYFAVAVTALHVVFAVLAWLMAIAMSRVWPVFREKFVLAVLAWFSLLAAAVLAFSALWYPRTLIGLFYHDAMALSLGAVQAGQVVYYGVMMLAAVVVVLAGRAAIRERQGTVPERPRAMIVVSSMAVVAVVTGFARITRSADVAAAADPRPNLIILGIDSLRLDELQRFGGTSRNTPNLDAFLANADLMRDTTTPAARTFSSWVAILTGRSPVQTGARFNLADRRSVAANPTIADILRQTGYRTVYSTDEVRFANIDESYGFDQRITPPIGASDFLIGTYNELPLTSVIVNTRLGQLLFPFSYGNRGVATMFQPATYLGRVDRELKFDRPTFFVAHLTASHWPYYTSSVPLAGVPANGPNDRPMYHIGLQTADSMFGQLVSMLERKGALRNALVVVLSDHGEALHLPNDSYFNEASSVQGFGAPLTMLDIGHGQSVLSPTQYHTLLSFRTFGPWASLPSPGRDFSRLTTVEDIAPTILDLLGVDRASLACTGESFAPLLRSRAGDVASTKAGRVRFTETDLAALPAADGTIDEVATARANSKFFEISPANGRLQIRRDFAPLALAYKERAAFTRDHLLAAIPAGPDWHQYIFLDIRTGQAQLILRRPDASMPEGALLWDALNAHYAGELRPAVRVTKEDLPAIDRDWANFFRTRAARAARGQPLAPTLSETALAPKAESSSGGRSS